jgi:3-methyladenine DNA glycosylase AlkD
MPTFSYSKLRESLAAAANAELAAQASAYMRGQFVFWGIKAPVRKTVFEPYWKEIAAQSFEEIQDVVQFCWAQPEREYHYFGMEYLFRAKKKWDEQAILLMEELICAHAWWDTVDYVAPTLAAAFFQKFPSYKETTIRRWNESSNMWLIRSSIIVQLKAKQKTDTDLLAACILPHTGSKEFFIQKAIGWALRQYSYTNPTWVQDFVAGYRLAPLSQREALKGMKRLETKRAEGT